MVSTRGSVGTGLRVVVLVENLVIVVGLAIVVDLMIVVETCSVSRVVTTSTDVVVCTLGRVLSSWESVPENALKPITTRISNTVAAIKYLAMLFFGAKKPKSHVSCCVAGGGGGGGGGPYRLLAVCPGGICSNSMDRFMAAG